MTCDHSLLLWFCALGVAAVGVWRFPPTELTRSGHQLGVARGRYEHFRRIIVDVVADAGIAGQEAAVREGRRVLARAPLAASGADATATLVLPMPPVGTSYGPLRVKVGRTTVAAVGLPDTELVRHYELYRKRLRFRPYVFDSDVLPSCEFEDSGGVEDLIGRYRISLQHLAADGNEVSSAAQPGRYGAIVEVRGEAGSVHRRFVTLYRTPEKVDWWWSGLEATLTLPSGLGIDPALAARSAATSRYARERVVDGMLGEDRGAVLLAGLHERSEDVWQANEDWWFRQRKRLGLVKHRYETVLPRGYADHPEERYPLIIFLHSKYQGGVDMSWVRWHGPWEFLAQHPEIECVLVAPQCDPEGFWRTAYVDDLMDEVLAKYRIDPDRIYLTGISIGGFGTWGQALAHPERLAAVAPICGGGDPSRAERMKEVPTWAFHGAKDDVVPLSSGQRMVDALRAAGGDVRFTVYPDAGHDSWTEAYNNPELYQWLFAHRRRRKQGE